MCIHVRVCVLCTTATRNVAMKKTLEVNGRLVRVSLQEDPMEDKIHKCPLGRTIVISNVPRTISDQHLQLYLKETCRQNEPVLQRKGSQCLATFTQDCAGTCSACNIAYNVCTYVRIT